MMRRTGAGQAGRRGLRWLGIAGALAVALLGTGCEDGAGPEEGVDESALEFLRFPADLAPLATRDTSFWAVAGQDRELILRYRPLPGESEGEEFLDFDVSASALLRRPDGGSFVEGDSIEIRVEVAPDGRFLFRFEPSGLQFSPDHPAELEITYLRLDGDLDGDGDVDPDDDAFEDRLQLWKQEAPGEPWFPVGTVKIEELDEVEADILSFTGFAIAI